MLPGLYHDLDIADYHGGHGLSSTGLHDLARSAFRYWAMHINPKRPPHRVKAGQLEGNLFHCALFETAQFNRRYAVVPKDAPREPTEAQRLAVRPSMKTLDAIAWWDDFYEIASQEEKTVITAHQRDVAFAQRESVLAIPDARTLLATGKSEVSAYYREPDTGVLLRCRPDHVHELGESRVILADGKTCSRADLFDFSKQIARKRYDWQESFYRYVYARAAKVEVMGFIFLAVEDEYPFEAQMHQIEDEGIEDTMVEWRPLVSLYGECMRTGLWPRQTAVNLVKRPRRILI